MPERRRSRGPRIHTERACDISKRVYGNEKLLPLRLAASGGSKPHFVSFPESKEVVSGYTGGHTENPTVPSGLRPRHRTRRGGRSDLRSAARDVRPAPRPVLANSRSHATQSPGARRRRSIPFGSLYARSRSKSRPRCLARSASKRNKSRPIVTQIAPAPRFWPAEEYHQRYFEKNGGAACHVIPGAAR